MSEPEAQELTDRHQDGLHERDCVMCPECLAQDLRAKARAVREDCARLAEGYSIQAAGAIRNGEDYGRHR